MGEKSLKEIVGLEQLIQMKYFNSESEIYNTPDSVLPRVRRGGKIVRPLRFYREDVDRLFAHPKTDRKSNQSLPEAQVLPTIVFKKRRK